MGTILEDTYLILIEIVCLHRSLLFWTTFGGEIYLFGVVLRFVLLGKQAG